MRVCKEREHTCAIERDRNSERERGGEGERGRGRARAKEGERKREGERERECEEKKARGKGGWKEGLRDVEREGGTMKIMSIRTEWRRCIRCLKLHVSFRKRATIYMAFLRKITYEEKSSYASSAPCIYTRTHTHTHTHKHSEMDVLLCVCVCVCVCVRALYT